MLVLSFLIILGLTFTFGYLNGVNGAGSVIATVVSSRALQPRTALLLIVICICAGPFLFGLAVAGTIGHDLVRLDAVTAPVMIASLAGAVGWISIAAWLRVPCSTTHAFIGSLVGAVWAGFGVQAIITDGITRALAALFLAPILGIASGYVAVKLSYRASTDATPQVNEWFKGAQVPISLLVSLAFGSNDGQKLIGIVALGVAATSHSEFSIPYWAASFSVVALALGTLVGSRRVSQVLGKQLYAIKPIHGFGAQTASGIVLLSAALLGSPVSGSQVIAAAIVGAGSAERLSMVRWRICANIYGAWLLTLPLAALVGAVMYVLISGLVV